MKFDRRQVLKTAAASFAATSAFSLSGVMAADDGTVTIAYNVNLPSWDPTVGTSAVNPTIQSIYRSVFDQFIAQQPNLDLSRASSPNGAGATTASRCGWMCARA